MSGDKILIIPICGYCIHFDPDKDFSKLYGNCEFKKDRVVAYRAHACRKWKQALGIEVIEELNKVY